MLANGILLSFTMKSQNIKNLVENLLFYVAARLDGGFDIQIVYYEGSWYNLIINRVPNRIFGFELPYKYKRETGIDLIQIHPDHFREMKRLKNKKSRYSSFGGNSFIRITMRYCTFDLDKLVLCLNDVSIQRFKPAIE
jgi:hypothetical protein